MVNIINGDIVTDEYMVFYYQTQNKIQQIWSSDSYDIQEKLLIIGQMNEQLGDYLIVSKKGMILEN